MKTLHLTLKRIYFDQILSGEKTREYRERKPYWVKRFFEKQYMQVLFTNGYTHDRPWMLVELKSIEDDYEHGRYILQLGKIINKGNIA